MRLVTRFTGFVFVLSCFITVNFVQASETLDNANLVCSVFENSGLLSEPCKVSVFGNSVDVSIPLVAAEANDFCRNVSSYFREKGFTFNQGWKIKIYSPYSNGNTIAQCNLPY